MAPTITISNEQISDLERIIENADDWAVNAKEIADQLKADLFRLLDSTGPVDDLTVLVAAANFRKADARKQAAFATLDAVRLLNDAMSIGSFPRMLRAIEYASQQGAEFVACDRNLARALNRADTEWPVILSDVA
jgi:predicted peroxiredoxin